MLSAHLSAPRAQAVDPASCSFSASNGRLTYCAGLKEKSYFDKAFVTFTIPGYRGGQDLSLKEFATDLQQDDKGLYYTCFIADFDKDIIKRMEDVVSYDCQLSRGVINTLKMLTTAGSFDALAKVNTRDTTKDECLKKLSGRDIFTINAQLRNPDDPDRYGSMGGVFPVCETNAKLRIGAIERNNSGTFGPGDLNPNLEPYLLCERIADETLRDKCITCATGSTKGIDPVNPTKIIGIWTGIGCVPTNEVQLIQTLVRTGLGISGGVALLMFIAAGFILSTSQGDQKRTSEAKELLTSAVFGLVFIIFSVAILQFIGVKVLQIPGFGNPATGAL
jgi:hypothetical protein